MTKPFRMKVRLQNNRLVRARMDLGLSQAAASRAIGIGHHTLLRFENLQDHAYGRGGWRDSALKIAEFYGYSPEYLWPDETAAVRKSAFSLELAAAEIHVLAGGELDQRELRAQVDTAMKLLTPVERKVLKRRFEDGESTVGIARLIDRSGTRASQIEQNGLLKLRKALMGGSVSQPMPASRPVSTTPEEIDAAIARATADAPSRRSR